MKRSRPIWVISATLAGMLAVGWYLERAEFTRPLRDKLHEQAVPAAMLRVGNVGEHLRRHGLVVPEANDGRFVPRAINENSISANVFRRKRTVNDRLLRAAPGGIQGLKSSRAVRPEHLAKGIPTISIWVDEADLYSPERGIVTNWTERWERPAQVSYYENGELVFGSGCGIRLHGGTTRDGDIMARRGLDWRSYRLYFRSEYGVDAAPPGLFVDERVGPIRTLIVRGNNWISPTYSFDVARRVGGLAPESKPARLVLNGESTMIYTLMDHLSNRQWNARPGYAGLEFAQVRLGPNPDEDAHERYRHYRSVFKAVSEAEGDGVREVAEELFGLEDYSRHMFAIMFVASADWGEAALVRSTIEPNAKWKFVHWDLDNSFRVMHGAEAEEGDVELWEKGFLDMALRPFRKADRQVRAILFQKLVEHDPAYPAEYARLSQDILNHELTIEWLRALLDRYTKAAEAADLVPRSALKRVSLTIEGRAGFVRQDLSNQFGLEPAHELTVSASHPHELQIDGRTRELPYTGWYFPRFGAELVVPPAVAERFSHWLVDGERVEGTTLRVPCEADTAVEAVFVGE